MAPGTSPPRPQGVRRHPHLDCRLSLASERIPPFTALTNRFAIRSHTRNRRFLGTLTRREASRSHLAGTKFLWTHRKSKDFRDTRMRRVLGTGVNRVSVRTLLPVRPVRTPDRGGMTAPCRDNRTISGFLPDSCRYPLRERRRIPTQKNKVPPNPPRDRSNGGVALPALVGVRT